MESLLERARAAMPGGVSSPVRSFGAVEGDPPFVARGQADRVWDAAGREYVDLVGSWGPLILGHAHPSVVRAVVEAAQRGLTFGATCRAEVELAEALLRRYPSADKVRFVSTGTEAVMSAVRLARGFTRRSRIVKFEGCYHGHADSLLVQAGSGLATLGNGAQPSSAGVPAALAELTEVLPLDDEQRASDLFARRGDEIAAVIVEPVPANAGLLLQRPEFLRHLRELTARHGALLIFDEVISGLRVAPGGACELYGIAPDIVTLGKIIGGGMPVGAYLARDEIMRCVAPRGPVSPAGPLSGNPLAMAAGLATLAELDQPGVYARLEQLGLRLQTGWERALRSSGVEASVARQGSILWLSWQASPAPRAWHAVDKRAADLYAPLHRRLLDQGCWMAPSAYEVAFLSTAHDEASIDRCAAALERALATSALAGART